jgi:broad specificity phosphatase PhoE
MEQLVLPILLKNFACMKRISILFFLILSIILTSNAQTYYIVRHAEKTVTDSASMMNSDPPLSSEGKKRATELRDLLKKKQVAYIYSTNTIRTRSTAEPLSKAINIPIQTYGPAPDATFINQLKALKGNTLIVGHSNTIDDIVNGLCGKQLLNDLPDAAYDNLFIVTNKNGQYELKQEKYGKKTEVRVVKKRA